MASSCPASCNKGTCVAALRFPHVTGSACSLGSQSWNLCPMLASSFCLLSQCGSQTPSLTSAVVLSSFLRLSDVAFSPCFWDLCSMLSSKSPPVASYQHKVPNFLALHDEDFSHLPSTSPLPYPLLHISTTKNLKNSSQSPPQSYTPMPPHMLRPLLGNLSTALLLLDNPNFF